MNCRFCGSFFPDGGESCPTCGRRPEEDPIGKLLSDNLPGKNDDDTPAARSNGSSTEEYVEKPLTAAIAMILLGIAGAIYSAINNIFPMFETVFRNGPSSVDSIQGFYLLGIGLALLLGVIGVITLIARLVNNKKARSTAGINRP